MKWHGHPAYVSLRNPALFAPGRLEALAARGNPCRLLALVAAVFAKESVDTPGSA